MAARPAPDPGVGHREHRTGDYLAGALADLGLEVARGLGGTGLVATLRRGAGGGALGLRADLDGLPLTERGARDHRSRHDGVMHACGHDGHMAMLLGAADILATEGGFTGTVHLVFQPAEEHGTGARAMIADGLFDRYPMDVIFGLHNLPGHPTGALSTRAGPLMAAEDNFEIRIAGRGGHAARPQMVIDPIVVAAEIVLALQTVVARSVDPAQPAVVSCTEVTTDGARNAIPGEVVLRGDTRSFTAEVRALLEVRLRQLVEGICAAHGATGRVTYTHEFAPTVNDPAAVATALTAARLTVPEDRIDFATAPWTASEDFGLFLERVPGCFVLLGTGVRFYVNLVRTVLAA